MNLSNSMMHGLNKHTHFLHFLQRLNSVNASKSKIRFQCYAETAKKETQKELTRLEKVLKDFHQKPLSFDMSNLQNLIEVLKEKANPKKPVVNQNQYHGNRDR